VLGYAEGMTSSGWLWLVQERNGGKEDLAIVATYGAATLLVYGGQPIRGTTAQAFRHLGLSDQGHVFEEQAMRAPAESPTLSAEGEAQHRAFSTTAPTAAAESSSSSHGMGGLSHRKPMSSAFGMPTSSSSRPGPTSGRPTNLLTVANELVPLACLSLHEHAYLPTHGVWGKRPYVQAWLSALDWEKIERRMVDPVARQRSSRYF
jgi:Fe-Mn family superoxide dismutase